MTPGTEFSDEDIQAQLAGSHVQGEKTFRGRKLAPYLVGLRDVVLKVVRRDDTTWFHDFALLHILAEAYAPELSARVEKRQALLAATDDVAGFRAQISFYADELSEEEVIEARRLADEILAPVHHAQAVAAEKKSLAAAAASSPIPKSSTPG